MSGEKCGHRSHDGLQDGYANVCLRQAGHRGQHFEPWHAEDCRGTCDGCGHIAEDGFWYNAPCPDALLQYQIEWAENGVPDAIRP